MENMKEKISLAATNDADLTSSEIPSIDLYLDQIVSLIADKNSSASECYRDRNLTKMMVNNYAKGGLIDPPNGKKYSKNHIIQMLLVNRLKSSLSMSEIKQLLDGIKREETNVIDLHDSFLSKKESLRESAASMIDSILDSGDSADAVFTLLTLSEYFKCAAKLVINESFPVAEEEKPEKADKSEKKEKPDKADKAEKSEKKENKKESKKKGEA